jgi:signal transduction histidine kinase
VENKNILLNTILEARRYEKNFFLTNNIEYVNDAMEFIDEGEGQFSRTINEYGSYAHSKTLNRQLDKLIAYKVSLKKFLSDYDSGMLNQEDFQVQDIPHFQTRQQNIRSLGRDVTTALEGAIAQERGNVKKLVQESRIYLFIFLGFILVISSITLIFLIIHVDRPLKRIEEAIKKISSGDYKDIPRIKTGDEFERLVDSLNSMLSELHKRSEQLVQSEKMAALGTLTSGVAHEINNPLNNISTSVQILLEELDEGDLEYQRELLTEAGKEVTRAQDIVKALLEFSRESEFTASKEQFKSLVNTTVKLIQGEIPTNVSVQMDVPSTIYACIDTRRIQQVLLNLMINGFQAMDTKGGSLIIKAYDARGGQGFIFEIQDTGQGIPEEKLSRIFDPFFTTKGDGSGSGLGLSISRGIIENHGGTINVQSKVGIGTTFTIFLPYKPCEDDASQIM